MLNDDHQPFLIRGYRRSDREAVRKLCCDTGFLGDPIDPARYLNTETTLPVAARRLTADLQALYERRLGADEDHS